MSKLLRWFASTGLFTVAVLTPALLPKKALAGDGVPVEGMFAVNFTGSPASPGIFDFSGNGIGILSNVGHCSFQLKKTLDTTLKVPTYSGTFTITAVNGDTLTGTYQGVGSSLDSGGYSPFSGHLIVTGGTGRFDGAIGNVSFSALSNAGTGQAVYSFKGSMQIQ